jgi:hypothetical protein
MLHGKTNCGHLIYRVMLFAMSYALHLNALICAAQKAIPGLSARRLSLRAGLNGNWVAEFMRTGRANFDSAEKIVSAVHALCPQGPDGDPLRKLLQVFDGLDRKEAAA